MGCKASRSELQLCKDIANVVASLPATTRPILWDDELSVIAHTVLNTLRNAHSTARADAGDPVAFETLRQSSDAPAPGPRLQRCRSTRR